MPRLAIFAAILTLSITLMASALSAQTRGAPQDGAYEKLSDTDRKIVSAIYEAQLGSRSDMAGRKLLTRDAIAALRKRAGGWDAAYRTLVRQGKVAPVTLSQAVSNHNNSTVGLRGIMTVVTTANGERIMVSPGRASERVSRPTTAPIKAPNARSTVVQSRDGQAAAVVDAGASTPDAAAAISAAGGVSRTAGQ
jgi:hypothetical protein